MLRQTKRSGPKQEQLRHAFFARKVIRVFYSLVHTAGSSSGYVRLLLLVGHRGNAERLLLAHPLDAAPRNRACKQSGFEMATYTAKTGRKHEAQESRGAAQKALSRPGESESSPGRGFEPGPGPRAALSAASQLRPPPSRGRPAALPAHPSRSRHRRPDARSPPPPAKRREPARPARRPPGAGLPSSGRCRALPPPHRSAPASLAAHVPSGRPATRRSPGGGGREG